MVLVLALAVLAQSPAKEPVRLGAVRFTTVRVSEELATSFQETFALRLAETGLVRVTTPRDVANLLGAERQKSLLGCADEATDCLAELAGALGVDGLVTGEVAQVGKVFQVTVKIISARDARVLFQSIQRLKSEEDVLEALDRTAEAAATQVYEALRGKLEVAPSRPIAPWVLMGSGVAVAIAGGVFQGLAVSDFSALNSTPGLTDARAQQHRLDGSTRQALGLTLLGVGGAVAIVGLLWGLLAKTPAQVSAWFSGDSAGLVAGGRW